VLHRSPSFSFVSSASASPFVTAITPGRDGQLKKRGR
jgi:hypothetical protein